MARETTAKRTQFVHAASRQSCGKRHELLGHGFTVVPNDLLRHQARLGLTAQELVLVLQIWSYWWEEPVLPYPGVTTLAAAMGCSERQARRLLAALAARDLLRIVPRHSAAGSQLSNSFDLTPLLDRLAAIGEERCTLEGSVGATLVDTAMTSATGSPLAAASLSPLTQMSEDQDTVPKTCNKQNPTIDERTQECGLSQHTVELPSTADPLMQRLQDLGLHRQDRAPTATAARLKRLRSSSLDDSTLLKLIDVAAATLTPEVDRPVPYLLAVLEDLAAAVQRGEVRSTPRDRVRTSCPASDDAIAVADPTAVSIPPLWQALLCSLSSTLAPAAVARLSRATAVDLAPDRLELVFSSAMEHAWCERVLRGRLGEALASLGCEHIELVLSVGAHRESGLLPCPA